MGHPVHPTHKAAHTCRALRRGEHLLRALLLPLVRVQHGPQRLDRRVVQGVVEDVRRGDAHKAKRCAVRGPDEEAREAFHDRFEAFGRAELELRGGREWDSSCVGVVRCVGGGRGGQLGRGLD